VHAFDDICIKQFMSTTRTQPWRIINLELKLVSQHLFGRQVQNSIPIPLARSYSNYPPPPPPPPPLHTLVPWPRQRRRGQAQLSGSMIHAVFGVVERISPCQSCGQTAAAGSQSKPAGATASVPNSAVTKLQSRWNVRAGAATAARYFGFFCR
jgi:hypothetical protein